MNNLIGFCGAAGAGKSTACSLLQTMQQDNIIIKFAEPIYLIAEIFGWNGVKDDKGRKLLQTISDLGLSCDPDWLLRHWTRTFIDSLETKLILVDDIRSLGELRLVKEMGGIIVKMVGRSEDLGINADHRTERGIPDFECDRIVNNNATVFDIVDSLGDLISEE